MFGWETDGASLNLIPLYNEIHHNFMIANYGAGMAIDNDDGSSYGHLSYNTQHAALVGTAIARRAASAGLLISTTCNRTVPSLQQANTVRRCGLTTSHRRMQEHDNACGAVRCGGERRGLAFASLCLSRAMPCRDGLLCECTHHELCCSALGSQPQPFVH